MYNVQQSVRVETRDLIVRNVTREDVPSLFQIMKEPLVSRYTEGSTKVTLEDVLGWVQNLDPKNYDLALQVKGLNYVVGVMSLYRTYRKGVWEFGTCLHPDFWGQGFGSQAVQALQQWSVGRPDFSLLTCKIAKENAASQGMVQRCGFSLYNETRFSKTDGSFIYPAWVYYWEVPQ